MLGSRLATPAAQPRLGSYCARIIRVSALRWRFSAGGRQRQADASPAARAVAAFEPAAVPDGISQHRGQAKPETFLDLPEARAGVFHAQPCRAVPLANLDGHHAKWPGSTHRIAEQVGDHPAKQYRVD